MPSLTTYEVVDVILPSILMVVIFFATFVLTVVGIICKRASWGFEKPNKPIPLVFLEMVDLAFQISRRRKTMVMMCLVEKLMYLLLCY